MKGDLGSEWKRSSRWLTLPEISSWVGGFHLAPHSLSRKPDESSVETLTITAGDSCYGGFKGCRCFRRLWALGNKTFEMTNSFLSVSSNCTLAFQFLKYSRWLPDANLSACLSICQKCFALSFLGMFSFLSSINQLNYHLLKKLSFITLLNLVSLLFLKYPIFALHRTYHSLFFTCLLFYVVPITTKIPIKKVITDLFVNLSDKRDHIWGLTKNGKSWGQWHPHATDVKARMNEIQDHSGIHNSKGKSAWITTQAVWVPVTQQYCLYPKQCTMYT